MSGLLIKNCREVFLSMEKGSLFDADIRIRDNVISEIGSNLAAEEGERVIEASNLVAVPGFVNTHHHFYQTLTRNLPAVQNSELFDWLVYLYDVWKGIDAEAIYYSSLLAMAELLKTGCTLSTDHHYLYPKNIDGDIMATQFAAADKLGMRFSPTRGSMSLSRKDGGLPPDSVVQDEDTILSDSERCIKEFHDPSLFSMKKVALAPCSPFSVTKRCMLESSRLARKYGVRLHTHLCETRDEEDTCRKMYGIRPVRLMQECELIGPDVFYAHGIWFNDEELKILRDTGSHIAHCPVSNMRLGSGICRVREMLDMGINVSIAVDGSASNDSSDYLSEIRYALMLDRVKYGAKALSVPEVLKMATENGARALNFEKIGRIEKGWAADLALFDVSGFEYAGSQSDPVASLIFCGTTHSASYTIVNGKVVVDDGHLVGIDEELLSRKGREVSDKLYRKAGIL
jgi:Cytosine deaminase and related metal-dependent hydrolases